MTGVLFSGALFGCAAIAWPVYLHFRQRRRPRIQVVPSLLLFTGNRQRARRLRLQQLLLLAARIGAVALLCWLLAQPWLRTGASLPLPALSAAADADRLHLGIVIDDSLTACHATAEQNRLEMGGEWLFAQLLSLPEDARITIAPTSFALPTPFLSRSEAMDLLAHMKLVPEPGNAVLALRNVAAALSDKRGCLLVVAPRDSALWGDLRPETDFDRSVQIQCLDTTACRAECFITAVQVEAGAGQGKTWSCLLAGAPPRVKGKELVLTSDEGVRQTQTVSMADALRRRVSLRVDAAHGATGAAKEGQGAGSRVPGFVQELRRGTQGSGFRGTEKDGTEENGPREQETRVKQPDDAGRVSEPPAWYTVSLKEPYSHPWFSWHFRAGHGGRGSARRVIMFRGLDAPSLAAEKILTAALLAAQPEVEIEHRLPEAGSDLAEAAALVFVGEARPGTELQPWLQRRIASGVRILCAPTPAPHAAATPNAAGPQDVFPAWSQAAAVAGQDVLPLQLSPVSALRRDMEPLLLAGLERMDPGLLMEPRFSLPSETVLATRDGRAVLAAVKLNPRSSVWALAAPVSPPGGKTMGAAEHPLFPLLVASILFPAGAGEDGTDTGAPVVGQSVDLRRWFDCDVVSGTLVAPDGTEAPMHGTAAQPACVRVGFPGRYVLKTAGGDRVAFANARREPESREFSRDEWAAARPHTRTRWLTAADQLDVRDVRRLAADGTDASRRDYDLSPVVIALLVLALLIEELLLLRTWRTPQAWAESDGPSAVDGRSGATRLETNAKS